MNTYHINPLSSRIAVLVDGDNIPSRKLDEIVRYAAGYDDLTVRKVFGDWTRQALSGWKSASAKYGFRLEQATAYTSGKNTSDLAIVMEAMDIMYQHLAETVCIASSDGDFTGIAQRLRESGIQVLGFGAGQTPESLVSSCSSFLCAGHVVPDLPACAPSAGLRPVIPAEPVKVVRVAQPEPSSQPCLLKAFPGTGPRAGNPGGAKAPETKKPAKKKPEPPQGASPAAGKEADPIRRDRQAFLNAFTAAANGKKTADMTDVSRLILKEFKKFRVKDYGCSKTVRIYEALGFGVKKEKKTFIQMPAGGIR